MRLMGQFSMCPDYPVIPYESGFLYLSDDGGELEEKANIIFRSHYLSTNLDYALAWEYMDQAAQNGSISAQSFIAYAYDSGYYNFEINTNCTEKYIWNMLPTDFARLTTIFRVCILEMDGRKKPHTMDVRLMNRVAVKMLVVVKRNRSDPNYGDNFKLQPLNRTLT